MQRADNRKYHYIYKITRDDGRYYIGMHSTDNLDDGYFGSGKRITRSIKKHGKERHTKEILEFLPTRKDLKLREKQLISEEIRADPLCMNIAPGGGGGLVSTEHARKFNRAGAEAAKLKYPAGSPAASLKNKKAAATRKQKILTGLLPPITPPSFIGRIRTEKSKKKISDSMRGKFVGPKNPQFGKKWFNDGKTSFLLGPLDPINANWNPGRIGLRLKNKPPIRNGWNHTQDTRSKIKVARSKQVMQKKISDEEANNMLQDYLAGKPKEYMIQTYNKGSIQAVRNFLNRRFGSIKSIRN